MPIVQDIFKASAHSFAGLMTGRSGTVSFKLPQYQRPYDWDTNNIQRLLQDCLKGLKGAIDNSTIHQYTFLGTVILTSDESKEASFSGESLAIIDGQQRLTTLLLVSCALVKALRRHADDITQVSDSTVRNWLEQETREQKNRLYLCTTGQTQGIEPTTPFPRMVRVDDTRGHRSGQSQYSSRIAHLLDEFSQYCRQQTEDFPLNADDSDIHLLVTYRSIVDWIEQFVYLNQALGEDQSDDFDPPSIECHEFASPECSSLFAKLQEAGEPSDIAAVLERITNSADSAGFVRLMLFASYLMQFVVLTIVETPSEDMAFDIFDALNTTGEPLTAVETLKPHIIRLEEQQGNGYRGSESEQWWTVLEKCILQPYEVPDERQKETTELVTGFALYFRGDKLGSDLRDQRNTLRTYFTVAEQQDIEIARKIVQHLSRLAQYRRQYWDRGAIDLLVGEQAQAEEYEQLRLCLRFVADSTTSTLIPILARYWMTYDEMDPERQFLQVLKAVVAFVALRRAVTGGTARIDSDFRKIMSQGAGDGGRPLCIGPLMANEVLDVRTFKASLRALLAERPLGVTDKTKWLNRAREIALGDGSQTACRLLLFAAAHNARADENRPGMLQAEGVISSDELAFLTHSIWTNQRYATLEHVAPASQSAGWSHRLYTRLSTRHTLGNLVLLPERENETIGNAPWRKKKFFYKALAAKTESERRAAIEAAQREGLRFGARAQQLIRDQQQLRMLEPIADVEEWTVQLVEARTENLLSLAWNQIAPWLFDEVDRGDG